MINELHGHYYPHLHICFSACVQFDFFVLLVWISVFRKKCFGPTTSISSFNLIISSLETLEPCWCYLVWFSYLFHSIILPGIHMDYVFDGWICSLVANICDFESGQGQFLTLNLRRSMDFRAVANERRSEPLPSWYEEAACCLTRTFITTADVDSLAHDLVMCFFFGCQTMENSCADFHPANNHFSVWCSNMN